MSDTTLSFNVLAKDNASRTIGKVGQSFGDLHLSVGKVMKGLVAVGPALAGLAVGAGIKQFIDDARESAKVGRITAQVVKSTGGAAKITADQVGALATAISNKTGADDEAIQSGQNLLLTFTNIRNGVGKGNDIFNQASQAITDMTAALNGGEVTAEGMKTSSIQLGKALNDPIKGVTALQKVGVSFTAKQKEQIKTLVDSGKTMEAQKIILGELSKEFGGAAAAAADPLTKLKTIAGNLSEQLGGYLLPVVDKFATFLGSTLIPRVSLLADSFVTKITPSVKAFAGFVNDRVIPGVEGLYNLLVKHDFSKEFRKAFHVEEDSGIVSFLLSINEGVKTAAANAKKWAGAIIAGLTGGLRTGDWRGLGSALGDGVIAGVRGISTAAGKILDALGALIDKIDWAALGGKIGKGLSDLLKSVNWKGLGDAVGNAISSIFQKASTLSDKVGKAFKDLMTKVDWKKIGRESTDAIGKFVEGVDWVHLAKMLGVAAFKSLKLDKNVYDTIVSSAGDLIIGMAEEIGKAIGKWFGKANTWLEQKGRELVGGLMHGASSQSSGIGKWLKQHTIDPVVGAFKDAGKWLYQHGKELITGLMSGIWSVAQGIDKWMVRAPVAHLLAPWYGAIKWLVGPGKNMIAGLIAGIGGAAKSLGNWVGRNVISPVVGAFAKAGTWLVQHGKNLIAGLKNGVISIARSIGSWVTSSVVSPLVASFSRSGTWLVQHGKNAVAGFKNGISSIATGIGRWAYDHVISPVVAPFGKAGTWLVSHGRNLIAGLQVGIDSMIKTIRSWVSDHIGKPIVAAVKWFFGIQSPSKVFAEMGGHMVQGLFKGLSSKDMGKAVVKIFGGMPQALSAIVNKGLVSFDKLPKKALDALGGAVGIGQPIGGPKGKNQSNEGIVRTLAAQYGWGSGGQWDSLRSLIMGESGFNSNAKNPTSTAYGLFQFLDSTWGSVGASKTSDPWGQTAAGLKYIARKYGSPANAYSQWSARSPHWYEKGTPWVPDDQLAFLHKGEAVLPRKVNEARLNGGGSEIVLRIESGGSKTDDFLVEMLRRYVRVNGGNVQAVLGRG